MINLRNKNREFPIEKTELDLLVALDDALRATRIIARDKNIRLRYERPKAEWPMEGDYGRLRQMFTIALMIHSVYGQGTEVVYIAPGDAKRPEIVP